MNRNENIRKKQHFKIIIFQQYSIFLILKVQAVKSVEKIYEYVLKRQGLQVEDINKLAESEHTTEKDFSKVILRIFRKFNLSTI